MQVGAKPHLTAYRPNVISVAGRHPYLGRMLPIRALLFALAILAAPSGAGAGGSSGPTGPVAEVDVLPGWRTDSGTHMAALRVRLAPGWKTYWRAPGDGGIPPRFGWAGSRNLASVVFHWPRAEVYEINGMRSIGYYHELILPMELTPERPGAPIRLRAEIELGVCDEVCVPLTANVAADLTAPGGSDPRIVAALADRPESGAEVGVGSVTCEVAPIRDGVRLTARIDMPRIGPDEVAVFELPDQRIWISESEGHRTGRQLLAASDVLPPSGGSFVLNRSDVRITVFGKDRAVELEGCSAG
jgi:hypothetical protein